MIEKYFREENKPGRHKTLVWMVKKGVESLPNRKYNFSNGELS